MACNTIATQSEPAFVPELPEVETVRRGLEQIVGPLLIQRVEVLRTRTVGFPRGDGEAFAQALAGCQLARWRRRGKYLISAVWRDGVPDGELGVHLRMTGQFRWLLLNESPVCKHTRVRFLSETRELRFVDIRSFGMMWRIPPGVATHQVMTGLQRLGPEPFDPHFDGRYLHRRLRASQRPIKSALLDQSVVAGVGNIYADECLFLARIRPHHRSGGLSTAQLQVLRDQLVAVLQRSIRKGGTSFRSFRDLHGINGNYGEMAWVYGREGEPCRHCGATIRRIVLSGRSSHWCHRCQP